MRRLCALTHNAMSTVKSRELGESPSICCFVSMSIQLLSKLRQVLRLWGMRFGHFGILYLNNKVSVKWGQFQLDAQSKTTSLQTISPTLYQAVVLKMGGLPDESAQN